MMEAPKETSAPEGQAQEHPERRCIASGVPKPITELIRFVLDPEGRVTPDLEERLPGRGIWVTATRSAVEKASAKGLFAKAAKRSVTLPDDFADRLEALLAKRCQQRLGLARKAGVVTLGFEKTRAKLQSAAGGALLEASDASADQAAKVRALAGDLAVVSGLSRAELAAALGRDNPVHGHLAAGSITDGLLRDDRRLRGFRDCPPNRV